MNVAQPLELSAFYFPDRVTLIFKDRRWTFRELDMEASALASSRLAQQQKERLSVIQNKLDRLLDAHLDGAITREECVCRKERLLHEKAALMERMAEVGRRGSHWLEPLEGFVKAAHQARSVASGPNLESLKDFSNPDWLEPSAGGPNPFFFLLASLAPSSPSPKKFKLVEHMAQCKELTRAFRFGFNLTDSRTTYK